MAERSADLSLQSVDPTESGVIHTVEYDVRRALLNRTDLEFGTLVVRRVGGGVCLEGSLLECPGEIDIPAIVEEATGVQVVANRLMVKGSVDLPPKG